MVLKNKEAKKYYEILKGIFPKATYLEARFLKDMQRSIADFRRIRNTSGRSCGISGCPG